ncbi:MAG TPA: hypothetical protein PLO23_04455 [Alphaproteobacteria bacterium]|nr:hypothetical protein [Alphaproteobacteria bacterium]
MGKSTVAAYLRDRYGYEIFKFKTPVISLLPQLGLTPDEIEGALKDVKTGKFQALSPAQVMAVVTRDINPALRQKIMTYSTAPFGEVTPRDVMDTILKSLFEEFGENVTTEIMRTKLHEASATGKKIVIDDLRFPHEYKMLEEMGAHFIRIERNLNPMPSPRTLIDQKLEGFHFQDIVKTGVGTLGLVYAQIDKILTREPALQEIAAPAP